ncbi:hypothetical protein HY771_02120 [Candidatus Uhrbacteria bacterium]|nr:hypothetical protein [Candidatus Uhrbacteria bacterium]
MASLRKAVPELQGEVYSDYLRVRSRSATNVLRATANSHPTLWERSVQANGTVVNYSCRDWADLARSGVLGVTRPDSGALIPNALNVVLISVLEAHERGVSEVYHLSGPDMVRYVGLLKDKFDELYTAVRSALPTWKLPETLTFNLVPAADFRLVVLKGREAALNELVETHLSLQRDNVQHGKRIQEAGDDRYKVIGEVNKLRKAEGDRLRAALANCPEVFYRIESANAPSQYDVLDAGGVHVHPWALEAPMCEISKVVRTFERHVPNK